MFRGNYISAGVLINVPEIAKDCTCNKNTNNCQALCHCEYNPASCTHTRHVCICNHSKLFKEENFLYCKAVNHKCTCKTNPNCTIN